MRGTRRNRGGRNRRTATARFGAPPPRPRVTATTSGDPGGAPPLTPDDEDTTVRRAQLIVCRHALDVLEAREFLAMLGLDPATQAARRARHHPAPARPAGDT